MADGSTNRRDDWLMICYLRIYEVGEQRSVPEEAFIASPPQHVILPIRRQVLSLHRVRYVTSGRVVVEV